MRDLRIRCDPSDRTGRPRATAGFRACTNERSSLAPVSVPMFLTGIVAGNTAGAGEHYRADLAIAERLAAADPTNAGWQRDLSVSHERLGDLAVAAGDSAGAGEHHRAALAIRERLAGADPTNAGWQRDLSISHNQLGDLAVAAGDSAGAGEHHRAALAIRERLAAADPTNSQ